MSCLKKGMILRFLPLLILVLQSFAYPDNREWSFLSSPDWTTNSPSTSYHIDTSFTDINGHSINGIFQASTTTGDSTWIGNSFAFWNFTPGFSYRYSLTCDFYVQTFSIYSSIFMGFTNSTRNVPINSPSAIGMGLAMGRVYEGVYIGFAGQSYYQTHLDTIVRPSLLQAGRTYRCKFSYDDSEWSLQVSRLPDNYAVYSSSGYFDFYSQLNDITHLTIGNKGYTSLYGNGIAVQRLFIDTLSITRDTIEPVNTGLNNKPISNSRTIISASPNPIRTGAVFKINLPTNFNKNCKFAIYSTSGKLVIDLTKKVSRSTGIKAAELFADFSNLPNGLYIARLKSETGTTSIPVSVVK